MPKWYGLLLQMAQAKREDATRGLPKYWLLKLKGYPDDEVCQALLAYEDALFPDPQDIVNLIKEARMRRAEAKKFLPCGLCNDGWVYVGEHEVQPCSCRNQWKKGREENV
jgi:hypothetical protein